MGIMDRLFRGDDDRQRPRGRPSPDAPGPQTGELTDEQAIERYRYMLRTAPPETVEQAHAEAFAKLTPKQRQIVLEQLVGTLPERERGTAAAAHDDPRALARMATRAELRQPGTMERLFGSAGGGGTGMGRGGLGMGGLVAGTLLSSIAGTVIGSMIAQHFFASPAGAAGLADASAGDVRDADTSAQQDAETTGADDGDYAAADADTADFDSDIGGGDFGDIDI